MGKAVVYNHLGNGLYSILYKQDNSRAKQREVELEDLRAELDTAYYEDGGLYDAVQKASLDYAGAAQAFNWAIEDWAECAKQLPPCEDHADLEANVRAKGMARIKAATAYTQAKTAAAKNRADYYAAQKEQGFISSTAKTYADGQVIQAWCISLDPENVIPNGTTVGTIETYGAIGDQQGGYLPKKYINIASTDAPEYSCAEHNRIQPASSMGTASWFNAYCQWLNAMANNPKFAVGTVTGKAGSLLNVALYGTTPTGSQPSGYPFGDTAGYAVNLANVPVDYLDCDAEPFEVGDRVIVRFSGIGRAGPTVVGFAENPKECPETEKGDWEIGGGIFSKAGGSWVWSAVVPAAGNLSHKNSTGDVASWQASMGYITGYDAGTNIYGAYTENTIHNEGNRVIGAYVLDGYLHAITNPSSQTIVLRKRLLPDGNWTTVWSSSVPGIGGSGVENPIKRPASINASCTRALVMVASTANQNALVGWLDINLVSGAITGHMARDTESTYANVITGSATNNWGWLSGSSVVTQMNAAFKFFQGDNEKTWYFKDVSTISQSPVDGESPYDGSVLISYRTTLEDESGIVYAEEKMNLSYTLLSGSNDATLNEYTFARDGFLALNPACPLANVRERMETSCTWDGSSYNYTHTAKAFIGASQIATATGSYSNASLASPDIYFNLYPKTYESINIQPDGSYLDRFDRLGLRESLQIGTANYPDEDALQIAWRGSLFAMWYKAPAIVTDFQGTDQELRTEQIFAWTGGYGFASNAFTESQYTAASGDTPPYGTLGVIG